MATVRARGWTDLTVDEVHVFPGFYEVEFDGSNGFKGPEVYVNRGSGAVGPEMGPNLMWDTHYGVARQACGAPLNEAAARGLASSYLVEGAGSSAVELGDGERHHGYWEFELKRHSQALNQINVKDCTRAIVDERMWQSNVQSTYAPHG